VPAARPSKKKTPARNFAMPPWNTVRSVALPSLVAKWSRADICVQLGIPRTPWRGILIVEHFRHRNYGRYCRGSRIHTTTFLGGRELAGACSPLKLALEAQAQAQ
jgi:hypothetical protein